ncbi:MAG: hypothetical protein ACHQQQ_15430 [Bacteroidota bacterium]
MMKYFFIVAFISLAGFLPARTQQSLSYHIDNDGNYLPLNSAMYSFILPEEYPYLVNAPEFAGEDDFLHVAFTARDSAKTDSTPHPAARKLLPDKISFMERGLWGENGLFRKVGITSDLTPETRKHELGVRRTMLTAHQIGGFLALGSMISACYFGQLILDGNPGYRSNHQLAVTASIITYSGTAMLSILSPPPLIRRDEVSTTTIHKTLAWVHFTGMVLTPILGSMIKHKTYDQKAHIHQISAYVTTAAMAASMIIVTF